MRVTSLTVLILIMFVTSQVAAEYDPLTVGTDTLQELDLLVRDQQRSREIPILVYLPPTTTAAPVVLFSHGLGGSRTGSAYLGKHWAARGYVAVYLQHPGSDDAIWKSVAPRERLAAMKQAAGVQNFFLRVKDVSAVLDQLNTWNTDASHLLANRLDMQRVGMSGHSFGATTTQAVSGQVFLNGQSVVESRIKAAVILSPSPPRNGSDVNEAFAKVSIPWMLQTGTHDSSMIVNLKAEDRQLVYPALPVGNKYELVLNKAEHSVFTEHSLPGEKQKRNPNHHRAILATTTAFWDAYLKEDAEAKTWLNSDEVREVLEPDDLWQKK